MKPTKNLLHFLGIHNSFNICTKGRGRVFIGRRARSAAFSPGWLVVGIRCNTDPMAHWSDGGCKRFDRKELEEAKRWASERYGIHAWQRDPFGCWQDAGVLDVIRALVHTVTPKPLRFWVGTLLPKVHIKGSTVIVAARTKKRACHLIKSCGAFDCSPTLREFDQAWIEERNTAMRDLQRHEGVWISPDPIHAIRSLQAVNPKVFCEAHTIPEQCVEHDGGVHVTSCGHRIPAGDIVKVEGDCDLLR